MSQMSRTLFDSHFRNVNADFLLLNLGANIKVKRLHVNQPYIGAGGKDILAAKKKVCLLFGLCLILVYFLRKKFSAIN